MSMDNMNNIIQCVNAFLNLKMLRANFKLINNFMKMLMFC